MKIIINVTPAQHISSGFDRANLVSPFPGSKYLPKISLSNVYYVKYEHLKLWSLINQRHQNTLSSIVVNQTQSEWFPVNQGVRQGGVLSTFLYLVHIDDLNHDLQAGSQNTGMLNIPSSCPSLSDDLL